MSQLTIKRLLRDLQEINEIGLEENIFAQPLQDNIFEWHANLVPQEGRYKGLLIHCVLEFPDDYPSNPPKIKLSTGIPHSNIIEHDGNKNYLCLDLLKNFFWMDGGVNKHTPYSGWSSAYSVMSIMMQLHTFLFDDYVENYDGRMKHTLYELSPEEGGDFRDISTIKDKLEKSFVDCRNCRCEKCGHSYHQPFPPININIPEREEIIIRKDIKKYPDEMELIIDKIWEQYYSNISSLDLISKMIKKPLELQTQQFIIKGLSIDYSLDTILELIPMLSNINYPAADCQCVICGPINEIINVTIESVNMGYSIPKMIFTTIAKQEKYFWNLLDLAGYNEDFTQKKITIENQQSQQWKIFTHRKKNRNKTKHKHKHKYKNKPIMNKNTIKNGILGLNFDILLLILEKLPQTKLVQFAKTNSAFKETSYHPYLWERREKICFYTKLDIKETILGIGISITFHKNSDQIETITTPLDLISYEAFNNNIRQSVWNEEFRFWLPMYINQYHGNKAKHLIEKSFSIIYSAKREQVDNNNIIHSILDIETKPGKYSVRDAVHRIQNKYGDYPKFKPEFAINILSRLMSQMGVLMMKGDIHLSSKALDGYCMFHQLFIQMCNWYPSITTIVEKRIENFIKDEGHRVKTKINSLGDFLSYLSITDKYNWKDIAEPYLEEQMDRNVLWILKAYPELAYPQYEHKFVDKIRINNSFNSTLVGKKLVAFNILFLQTIAKKDKLDKLEQLYNTMYGSPGNKLKQLLSSKTKNIEKIKNYLDFYHIIDIKCPIESVLADKLRKSIFRSERKKYHNLIKLRINESIKKKERYYKN